MRTPVNSANITLRSFPRRVSNAVRNTASIPLNAKFKTPNAKRKNPFLPGSYASAHPAANSIITNPITATATFGAFTGLSASTGRPCARRQGR